MSVSGTHNPSNTLFCWAEFEAWLSVTDSASRNTAIHGPKLEILRMQDRNCNGMELGVCLATGMTGYMFIETLNPVRFLGITNILSRLILATLISRGISPLVVATRELGLFLLSVRIPKFMLQPPSICSLLSRLSSAADPSNRFQDAQRCHGHFDTREQG
jgi:hypothetical protein